MCWKAQEDLTKQWRGEKDDMERLQSVKEEIDRVNLEIQGAERDYDLNRAAELKYGTLMDLQKQLKGAEVALEKQVGKLALGGGACLFCLPCSRYPGGHPGHAHCRANSECLAAIGLIMPSWDLHNGLGGYAL